MEQNVPMCGSEENSPTAQHLPLSLLPSLSTLEELDVSEQRQTWSGQKEGTVSWQDFVQNTSMLGTSSYPPEPRHITTSSGSSDGGLMVVTSGLLTGSSSPITSIVQRQNSRGQL